MTGVVNDSIEINQRPSFTTTTIKQAWDFVMGMPEKPGSDVWAALLSSCQLHGDVEMASIAANKIFKLKYDSRSGAYVALSNAQFMPLPSPLQYPPFFYSVHMHEAIRHF